MPASIWVPHFRAWPCSDGDVTVINNRVGASITPSVLFQLRWLGAHHRARGPGCPPRDCGNLIYDAKRFIGKQYVHDIVSRESTSLPFQMVPGFSHSRSQLEPHLRRRGRPTAEART